MSIKAKHNVSGGGITYPPGHVFTEGQLTQLGDSAIARLRELGMLIEDESPDLPEPETVTEPSEPETAPEPSKPETVAEPPEPEAVAIDFDNLDVLVLVNKGSVEDISRIKGVGEATAKAIIAERELALFTSLESLKEKLPNINWDNPELN